MVIPLPMGVVDEVEDHNHTMCYQDFLLEAGANEKLQAARFGPICALISGHESNDSSWRAGPCRERKGNGKTRLLALSLSLLIRTERSFRKARPICFVAAKD